MSGNKIVIEDEETGFIIEIINLHDCKRDCFYVGRGSSLGNPFSHKSSKYEVFQVSNRDEAIREYDKWIHEQIKYNTPQSRSLNECVQKLLFDKKIVLGCYCVPLPCHSEVLAKIILEMAKDFIKKRELFTSD